MKQECPVSLVSMQAENEGTAAQKFVGEAESITGLNT